MGKASQVNSSSDVDKTQRIVEEDGVFQGKGPAPSIEEEVVAVVENNPGQVVRLVGLPAKRKRRKGEDINPSDWERNVNSAKRRKGEPYLGLKKQEDGKYNFNIEREERKLRDRCSCKNVRSFRCEKVTEMDRHKLFINYWKNIDSWEAKRATIVSLVDKSKPDFRRGTTDIENSRKNVSFKYYLKVGDDRIRVCKKMFLNTFSLGEKSVRSWVLQCALYQPLAQEILENNLGDP